MKLKTAKLTESQLSGLKTVLQRIENARNSKLNPISIGTINVFKDFYNRVVVRYVRTFVEGSNFKTVPVFTGVDLDGNIFDFLEEYNGDVVLANNETERMIKLELF